MTKLVKITVFIAIIQTENVFQIPCSLHNPWEIDKFFQEENFSAY